MPNLAPTGVRPETGAGHGQVGRRVRTKILILLALLAGVVLLVWWRDVSRPSPPQSVSDVEQPPLTQTLSQPLSMVSAARPKNAPAATWLSAEERQWQKWQRLLEQPGARPHEAVLKFSSPAALSAFLGHAKNTGLQLLGQLDRLDAVCIGYDQLGQLSAALSAAGTDVRLDANFVARTPDLLQKEDRPAGSGTASFESDGFLSAIGATGDRAAWGHGVTVAVVDSGVEDNPTFSANQVTHVDLVGDDQPFNGHGTAMASLIAGQNWQAAGVAPAAQIIDVRIADATGTSDSFTLANGIIQAADAGAQIINVSLGSDGDSTLVRDAIAYAQAGGAVIIAAAGNDATGNQLRFPAAIPSVIAVGGVDAQEAQAYFSNSGPGLDLVAPAVGIQSAYGQDYIIIGDGTSQATAIVSGVLAQALARGATTAAGAAAWLEHNAKPLNLPPERGGAGLVQIK